MSQKLSYLPSSGGSITVWLCCAFVLARAIDTVYVWGYFWCAISLLTKGWYYSISYVCVVTCSLDLITYYSDMCALRSVGLSGPLVLFKAISVLLTHYIIKLHTLSGDLALSLNSNVQKLTSVIAPNATLKCVWWHSAKQSKVQCREKQGVPVFPSSASPIHHKVVKCQVALIMNGYGNAWAVCLVRLKYWREGWVRGVTHEHRTTISLLHRTNLGQTLKK